MCTGRRLQGYSLYELLMTLLLVSTVLTLGLPSFGRIAAEQRLRTEVDRLFHAIHVARKSSIARRRAVTICASADGRGCDPAGDWSQGWILFVNKDRDQPAVRDPDEVLLQARRSDETLRVTANRRSFTFRSTELRATNGTLLYCDRAGRAAGRALVISYTGRPRVSRTDRRGQAVQCPD